jgi:hypothetical protein
VATLGQVNLADDYVFGDDEGASQLGTVTGDVKNGYAVTLTVGVDTTTEPTGGGMPGGSDRRPSGEPGVNPPSGVPSGGPSGGTPSERSAHAQHLGPPASRPTHSGWPSCCAMLVHVAGTPASLAGRDVSSNVPWDCARHTAGLGLRQRGGA